MKSLNIRDLINIGIFTAIYYVMIFAGAMIGVSSGFMPIGWLLATIVNSMTIALFIKRVPKFGVLTILSTIVGAIVTITGHSLYSGIAYVVVGLAADIIANQRGYKDLKFNAISYGVLQLAKAGPFLPMFINQEQYFAQMAIRRSPQVAAKMQEVYNPLNVSLMLLVLMIIGFTVSFFGQKAVQRNFSFGKQVPEPVA